MKNSITRLVVLTITLISASFGLSQQPTTSAKIRTPPSTTATKSAPAKPATVEVIKTDMKEALSVIENNYVGGSKLNYNDVVKSSIDSMLSTLDPHSNYFDAKEFEQFMTDQSSRYYGIGATIGDLSDADGKIIATYIKATFDGAPANRAGLRYGDKIVEVNGQSMLGKPFNEVRSFLRGPQGTTAKLVVEHLATGKRETVDIIRDAVPQPSISEIYMIRPGVGYMKMSGGFNSTTYGEFARGMRDLKAQGMTQLVLDLRGNGGGLVNQAHKVASTFLNYGQTVFSQKGRIEGVNDSYPADNRLPDRSPVVMLVDRSTASASEILAGALQDHDRALIVGEDTFGKGLVQQPFRLDYGSMLLLTIAKYETPAGRLIQRDYSNGDRYNYFTEGGSFRDDPENQSKPKGAESKTDTGRAVYSGGGINPDVAIKPDTITNERNRAQGKLLNPIFAYTLDLVMGKAKGFENYSVNKPIVFDYNIKTTDFPVTESLYQGFKKYTVDKFKVPAVQIDREREFVEHWLRYELITAAYGSQTSFQVHDIYDSQLQKAIDLLPQAKQLAMQSEKVRTNATKTGNREN